MSRGTNIPKRINFVARLALWTCAQPIIIIHSFCEPLIEETNIVGRIRWFALEM